LILSMPWQEMLDQIQKHLVLFITVFLFLPVFLAAGKSA